MFVFVFVFVEMEKLTVGYALSDKKFKAIDFDRVVNLAKYVTPFLFPSFSLSPLSPENKGSTVKKYV